jgi:hypothetical protein
MPPPDVEFQGTSGIGEPTHHASESVLEPRRVKGADVALWPVPDREVDVGQHVEPTRPIDHPTDLGQILPDHLVRRPHPVQRRHVITVRIDRQVMEGADDAVEPRSVEELGGCVDFQVRLAQLNSGQIRRFGKWRRQRPTLSK